MNSVVSELLKDVEIPKMFRVRQIFRTEQIDREKIPALIYGQLSNPVYSEQIRPDMRIAVTVGSRQIANVRTITKTIVDFVKACGAQPFIVPAMGSHGGATAEGQQKIVEDYGCTEAYLGCPIPDDAPPRPDATAFWNEATHSWSSQNTAPKPPKRHT